MEVSELASVDVCIVGAGSAGSSAAIAAARGGASVLLVDRLPFLGGTSTSVLDTFYGFYTPGSVGSRSMLEAPKKPAIPLVFFRM